MSKKSTGGIHSKKVLLFLIILLCAVLALALAFLWMMGSNETLTLTVEAGSDLPQASAFLSYRKSDAAYLSDTSLINMDIPGQYPVEISGRFGNHSGILTVLDTVAPTATVSDLTVYNPAGVKPEDLVTDIQDATAVTAAFAAEPDLSLSGEQTVTVVLTDLGGNVTKLESTLTVILDNQAPTISGVKDIITYVGDAVAYKTGITVTDDQDENAKLELDNSQVDLTTAGVYKIIYNATDAAGNTTSVEAQVTVQEKRENHVELEVIYEAVDAVLAKFITDDMTDREKVEAIYVWSRHHMTYGGHTDTTDYLQSAYQFLTTRKGDCFGYFALQKLMFQRLNIPTIDVRKVKNYPGDSDHYWLLVSIDGGENYYHMDNVWSWHLCLVTDEYLNDFSRRVKNCFNRDESLYPPTPKEALPSSTLPWDDPTILNAVP